MNYLINDRDCNLMIWELNPKKRNTNNTINFVVPNDRPVNVGDTILGREQLDRQSHYKITEILERRPASLKKRDYIVAKSEWSIKSIQK